VLIFVLRVLIDDESLAWRSFAIVASISIVAAIYLSDSRNAWVSVSAGVAVYALARATPDRQRFVSSVVAAAFLGTFLLLALGLNEETRSALFPRGDSFRAEIWAATLERILEGGPWFGVGILTDDEVQVGEQLMLHPHNLYLAVFYQGGLVGLALFVGLLLATFSTLFRHYQDQDAKLALGVLGIAVPAYMLDGFELIDKVGSTWFLIWLPVAVALSLRWPARAGG
jgi:O-antigen ligase